MSRNSAIRLGLDGSYRMQTTGFGVPASARRDAGAQVGPRASCVVPSPLPSASNRSCSQQRADSVRAYIIKRGIASNRMVSKGYGENVPIADNRTADGRSQNRRVEFVITER